MVIFSKVTPIDTDPIWMQYQVDEITEARTANQNIWEQFLNVETMRFGAYLLPDSLGGDDPLTHTFDEVNIVLSGEGVFKMGSVEIDIQPGSLIFLEAGVPHNFISTGNDLEILILFEGH